MGYIEVGGYLFLGVGGVGGGARFGHTFLRYTEGDQSYVIRGGFAPLTGADIEFEIDRPPDWYSFISRLRSGYGPPWTAVQTRSV